MESHYLWKLFLRLPIACKKKYLQLFRATWKYIQFTNEHTTKSFFSGWPFSIDTMLFMMYWPSLCTRESHTLWPAVMFIYTKAATLLSFTTWKVPSPSAFGHCTASTLSVLSTSPGWCPSKPIWQLLSSKPCVDPDPMIKK